MSEITYHKVKSLAVAGGFLDGLKIDFSNGHNCIIGGRGTGKTTVLEFIRWALEQMPSSSESQSKGRRIEKLIEANLGSGQITVEVETKNGVLYKVQRSLSNDPIVLDDKGNPVPIEIGRGNIFSIEIYSQNQIEEIADDPLFQLKLIDKFIFEDIKKINVQIESTIRDLDTCSNDLITLRNEITGLKEKSSELPEVIEKLKAFQIEEGGEEADSLKKESTFKALRTKEKRCNESLIALFSELSDELDRISQSTESRLADDFIDEVMKGQNSELFKEVKKIAEGTVADVKDKIDEAIKIIRGTVATLQDKSKVLAESHLRQDKTYNDFLEQHEKEKGKAQERDILLKRQSQLQEYQSRLEKRQNDYLKKGIERQKFLRELSELKDKRFKLRDGVAKKLTSQLSPTIHVSIEPFGNTDQYRDILLESMKGTGLRYANIVDKIVQRIPPQEFSAIVLRADAKSLADQLEIDTDRANRIILQLKDSRIIYNIDVVELHDRPSIELKDGPDYKNAGALSTGQKCTTILPILLLESESPLLIDQPEDNLDNAFIYETVVQSIVNVKNNRQLVFITHNPNIPVLGDADLVFVLSSTGRKAEIKTSGTVDDVKSEIETILEGGKEAFLKRKKRYGY